MLRLLGRYILREVTSSALLGTFLATFVIFLQSVDKLFDVLVRGNVNAWTVLSLFALAVPPVLPLTIPFGMLVGILIGLGRMASDGEIIAMRAGGVSSRKVIAPVLVFAAAASGMAAYASLRLTPLSYRESNRIINQLMATRLSAEIQPRVFTEDFPNVILYVGDVRPGDPVLWRNVFMADVTSPEHRSSGMREKAEGPLITVAREAVAVSDSAQNRIQLSLRDASTYEMGKDLLAHDITFPRGEQALDAAPPATVKAQPFHEMNTRQLLRYSGPDWIEARVELHRRFALPAGCIMLALVGIPLGLATRKGGKSAGYVTGVFIAFFCYHLSSISLIGMAKQRTLPVPVAIWLPDIAFGIAGIIFLARMERPGDRDLLGTLQSLFTRWRHGVPAQPGRRLALLPQLVDTYVLSNFLFYFLLWLASLVSMTLIYNFFELIGDMIRNHIPLLKMFTYLFFLSPTLIYTSLPISILLAVLGAFGVMTKQNEVTAFKACGVSLFRLALPVFVASVLFTGGLFAFDFYYVPGANRKQDALRDEIKGRATQTYLNPNRKWIWGASSRIYYYKYFDPNEHIMAGVYVFELEPATFHLNREIYADRAHWNSSLKTWVFENGWSSDFQGTQRLSTRTFGGQTFPELTEDPGYFLKEALQDKQMNFLQLDRYIHDLQQSGFDTVRLQVQFYRKFSVPVFAIIMALIAIPFAFLVGSRGAMTGVGVSIAIAIIYWGINILFEKIGDVNQLPPAMAAWSPDALFSLASLYLLMRMRS
ncbi:MAG: LPS export ABC transporter permease LptF [Terriglobia bacterium]|nr:MAG: LPS export ABC transporter permease LptF [Terriglobia bacterium]